MKRYYPEIGLHVPTLLLPNADVSLETWSVVACDQYTSQPEYWDEVRALVGDKASTLNLILPEAHLGDDRETRINEINTGMASYLEAGIVAPQPPGFMLVERESGRASPRRGLVVALDLERYDYRPTAKELIRCTEGTDPSRLPARAAVRREAPLETPHIMVLIDDPDEIVIEPLFDLDLPVAYDFELMKGGGRLRGWHVRGERLIEEIAGRIAALRTGEPPLVYAMGDGNHSFAAAKTIWDELKSSVSPDHPGRYGLVELVNVHDAALDFEPIHRLLDGVDVADLLAALEAQGFLRTAFADPDAWRRACNAPSDGHRIPYVTPRERGLVEVRQPETRLATATLHAVLDPYLRTHADVAIDYIHGDDVLADLAAEGDRIGFLLPTMDKHDLFRTVIEDGATPRKTFSLGEAHEKRFYLECRRIR